MSTRTRKKEVNSYNTCIKQNIELRNYRVSRMFYTTISEIFFAIAKFILYTDPKCFMMFLIQTTMKLL